MRATAGTRALAAALLRGPEPAHALAVLDGPLAGRRFPLGAAEVVGRGAGATVRLPDPALSRTHLRLRAEGGAVLAREAGSRNGSAVNGRRLRSERRLRPGDLLCLGGTQLRLELAADPAPASAPRLPPGSPARRVLAAALLAAAAALLLVG